MVVRAPLPRQPDLQNATERLSHVQMGELDLYRTYSHSTPTPPETGMVLRWLLQSVLHLLNEQAALRHMICQEIQLRRTN